MKILVVGSCVLDTIVSDQKKAVQPGGIFYSICGLNAVRDENVSIELLTNIDKSNYHYFGEAFSNVNLINELVQREIPNVILEDCKNSERKETYLNFSDGISFSDINKVKDYDAILINMITGIDITLNNLSDLRDRTDGLIYLDIHTLSRGIDENGSRNFRKIPGFEKWLDYIDILQANESEILTLTNFTDENEIAEIVLSKRVKIFIVTKGKKGSKCYYKSDNGIDSIYVPVVDVKSINSVGCGDIFGSVFFYSYISGLNLNDSLKKAALASALATTFTNIKDFEKLEYAFNRKYT